MRNKTILFSILLFAIIGILVIPYGCKKDKEEPVPVKKYAWAVGSADSTGYGTILFTQDGGETWQRQGEGSAVLQGIDLFNVCAVDQNTVWVVGSDNHILKTSDGGKTWVRIPAPLNRPEVVLVSVSLAGKDHIWISGIPGIVYNSKDGGLTWTLMDTTFFQGGIMQGIHAIDAQTIYVAGGIGSRGFIARTLNGGQTWDSVVPEHDYNRHEWIGVKAADPAHIVVYGVKSHFIYSDDGGVTWRNDSVPNTGGIGGSDINCLTMLDAQTWWGAFDYDGIFLTTNSGTSWTKQPSVPPAGMWLFGIDYYNRKEAIIVAQSSMSLTGKIMITSDGGETWKMTYHSRTWMNKVSVY